MPCPCQANQTGRCLLNNNGLLGLSLMSTERENCCIDEKSITTPKYNGAPCYSSMIDQEVGMFCKKQVEDKDLY
jgi:hypothetical protein